MHHRRSLVGDLRVRVTLAGVLVSLVLFLCCPLSLQAEWTLLDGARVHPDYHGPVPKKSDVIFSTRFKRPEALDVIRAFGATRVEWVYSADTDFITSIKAETGWFGGTLNSNAPLPNENGMAKDFDGNTLVHPRMKAWGGKWITTTHPDTLLALQNQARKVIEAGANSIQIDDPLLQVYSAYSWGGDFNRTTLDGFNRYLLTYPNEEELARLGLNNLRGRNYRDFLKNDFGIIDARDYQARYRSLPTNNLWDKYLKSSVRDHYSKFRLYMDGVREQHVPISMNLAFTDRPDEKTWDFFLGPFADYVIAETPIGNPNEIVIRSATFRAMGLGYVPSIRPRSTRDNRLAIAMFYALGAQPLVPWDIYIGNDETGQAKRYFGTPEEYASLYAFVQRHRGLFDANELAAVIGIPIPVDKFRREETDRLVIRLIHYNIPFAFILTGGTEKTYEFDPVRSRHLKALITVNPDTDFTANDVQAFESLGVKRLKARTLTDKVLKSLSPFLSENQSSVRLFPRGSVTGPDRELVIHVIDNTLAETIEGNSCRRTVGLRKSMLGRRNVNSVTWLSPNVTSVSKWEDKEEKIVFPVPECTLWGALAVRLD